MNAALLLWVALAAVKPTAGRVVYTVDLNQALLATPEGKALQRELLAEARRAEDELRKKEAALAELALELERSGDPALAQRYDEAAARMEAETAEVAGRLARLEEEKGAGLVAKLEAELDRVRARAKEALILDAAEHQLLVAPAECALALSPGRTALPAPGPCGVALFLEVDLPRLRRALPAAQAASARLDRFERDSQAELEREQARVALLAAEARDDPTKRASHEQARLGLARRFARVHKEQARMEAEDAPAIERAVEALIGESARGLSGLRFVAKGEGPPPRPSCDATQWLVLRASGQRPALAEHCPEYGRGRP